MGSGAPIVTGWPGCNSGQGRRDGRLGRSIGIEELPARPRQASTSASGQASPPRLISRTERQRIIDQAHQGRHGVHHGDPLPGDRRGQLLGIADAVGRRDPERRADQVRNPDLLERHVEGHGEALVDQVVFTHAQHFVLARSKATETQMRSSSCTPRTSFSLRRKWQMLRLLKTDEAYQMWSDGDVAAIDELIAIGDKLALIDISGIAGRTIEDRLAGG